MRGAKKFVTCPFCDEESVAAADEFVVKCRMCGEAFEIEPDENGFW